MGLAATTIKHILLLLNFIFTVSFQVKILKKIYFKFSKNIAEICILFIIFTRRIKTFVSFLMDSKMINVR